MNGTNPVCDSYEEPDDYYGCARCGHSKGEHHPLFFGFRLPSEEDMRRIGRAFSEAAAAMTLTPVPNPPLTGPIRVCHPQSGSVLSGEVTAVSGEAPQRSFRFIPDGLLEEVVIREGVWTVVSEDED